MGNRFSSLKCKEVVCICDVEVDIKNGCIGAIVVPGPSRCFGLIGRHEDYVIPWCAIRQIGDDIILVDADLSKCRLPRAKRDFF